MHSGRESGNHCDDWICRKCSSVNFESRKNYLKCQKVRESCKKVARKRSSSPGSNSDREALYKKTAKTNDKAAKKRHLSDELVTNSTKQSKIEASSVIKPSQDKIRNFETLLNLLRNSNITHIQIEETINFTPHVWLKCWETIDQFSIQNIEVMLEVLTKISCSVIQDNFPSIEHCRKGVERLFTNLNSASGNGDSDKLNKVEIVHNMVKNLIAIEWKEEKGIVKNELITMLSLSSDMLKTSIPDHRKTIKSILETLDSLEKPWTIKEMQTLKTVKNSTSLVEMASKSSSWQNVNVSWLANVSFFQPALLPVMKVPSNTSDGVYNNVEEYFEIVTKLWIGLTFIDGNSNLNPKCCHKFQEKECGQVLLPSSDKPNGVHCLNSCPFPVVLHCPDSRHNKGFCSKCATKAKSELMGPAGPHASTNIYDCQVTKVDYEGRIFMNGVESRKPPCTTIHWRSTRRLSSPNLVGLIKLKHQGFGLNDNDIIIWGEIISHGNPRDEFKKREEKMLCVSIANINDSKLMDHIKKDDYLAVIDCMTFAPERIPVLKALDVQKVCTLPFQKDPSNVKEESKSDLDDIRDSGVPDKIWNELQLAKLAAKEEKKREEERQANEKKYQEDQETLLKELLAKLSLSS